MRKISLSKKDKRLSLKVKIILIVIIILIATCGIGTLVFFKTYHVYKTNVINPTCKEKGYTESICIYCKKINRTNYTAALGHDWGKKIETDKAAETSFGKLVQTCSRCHDEKIYKIEPTSKMKKFYFNGDAFYVDSNRAATGVLTYSYKNKKIERFVRLKYMDSSSSKAIKHDYNIEFYEDEKLENESNVSFIDGKKAVSEWSFYGNYHDFYNLRDTVASELFREIRAKSNAIDERLKQNYGTEESEPVLLFINDIFAGIYRLSKTVTNETFNMSEKDKNCAIVRTSYASNESFFKKQTDERGPWRIRYNSADDKEWIYNSLNKLINFVMNKDGESFKKGISKYLDIDGMIDYMLTVYNTCAADNVGRNFTLATYDGKVWTPSVYDMNFSFGLNNKGEVSNLETILAPSKEKDKKSDKDTFSSDTNSLLWDKMLENFYDEIKERYNKLKDNSFSAKNIYSKFENHIKELPDSIYNSEKEQFPGVDSQINLKDNISDFVASRRNIFSVFFE